MAKKPNRCLRQPSKCWICEFIILHKEDIKLMPVWILSIETCCIVRWRRKLYGKDYCSWCKNYLHFLCFQKVVLFFTSIFNCTCWIIFEKTVKCTCNITCVGKSTQNCLLPIQHQRWLRLCGPVDLELSILPIFVSLTICLAIQLVSSYQK